MNCPDCDLHLQRLLDGDDAPAAPDLTSHLAGCPACRDRQAAALLLVHGLRKFPQPAPSPGLNQRILAAVLADRQERLTWRRRLALLATAAAFPAGPVSGDLLAGPTGTLSSTTGPGQATSSPQIRRGGPARAQNAAVTSTTEGVATRPEEVRGAFDPVPFATTAGSGNGVHAHAAGFAGHPDRHGAAEPTAEPCDGRDPARPTGFYPGHTNGRRRHSSGAIVLFSQLTATIRSAQTSSLTQDSLS